MPPNKKFIPLEDIKGLKTLRAEGKNNTEIAKYYSERLPDKFGRMTVSRKIEELEESEK